MDAVLDGSRLAHISLGTNLGDRLGNLISARRGLESLPGIKLQALSSIYETEAVGMPGGGPFLNAVCSILTSLNSQILLEGLQKLETAIGRREKGRMMPRVIDIDLLLLGSLRIQKQNLIVPHPRMHERKFVLVPLCEISPEAFHPVLKKTVRDILLDLGDENGVRLYGKFPE